MDENELTHMPCAHKPCGQMFPVKPKSKRGRAQLYCSVKCRNAAGKIRSREREGLPDPTPRPVPRLLPGKCKPSRVDPTTCERDYDQDECDFLAEMERYKKTARRPFPTWSEALRVLKGMGYRRMPES